MTKAETYLSQHPEAEVGVAAVNRALIILAAFSRQQPRLSLAQLAANTGLYKSTILRLTESLEAFGYLKRLGNGDFLIGPTPLKLAAIYQQDLQPAEQIIPVLRVLTDISQESASFYVRSDDKRLCAYRIHSPRAVRDHVQVGELLPLDRGAAGQVLLAFSARKGAPYDEIRHQGFAMSRGERSSETAAVAAPVFGFDNQLEGALCLSGPIHRFDDDTVNYLSGIVVEQAARLSAALGGCGSSS